MTPIRLTILVTFIAACFYIPVNGQDLRMEKEFGGFKFYNGQQALKLGEVQELMKSNEAAYKEIKKARGNFVMSNVLAFAGGALIGWPVGTALGGGDPQWGLAGAGAGLVLIAIPLSIGFKNHATKAVDLYNAGETNARQPSLSIFPTGTGMKLVFKF